MTEQSPKSVVELFQRLVGSGELPADLKMTIHVAGGPGPQLEEHYILAGTGNAALSRRDRIQHIERQLDTLLDQATCRELFEQVSSLLPDLSERPAAPVVPDSLLGLLLIEAGGQFARFIFLPQQTRQKGKSILVGSPIAAVVERFRTIIAAQAPER